MGTRDITRSSGGFSFLELVLVLSVIGLVSMIALPRFARATSNASADSVARDLAAVINAARNNARAGSTTVAIQFDPGATTYSLSVIDPATLSATSLSSDQSSALANAPDARVLEIVDRPLGILGNLTPDDNTDLSGAPSGDLLGAAGGTLTVAADSASSLLLAPTAELADQMNSARGTSTISARQATLLRLASEAKSLMASVDTSILTKVVPTLPRGARVASANFGGDSVLIFDGHGLPDTGGAVVVSVGSVQRRLEVAPGTGEVTVSR